MNANVEISKLGNASNAVALSVTGAGLSRSHTGSVSFPFNNVDS